MQTIHGFEPNAAENPKAISIPLNEKYEITFTFKDPYGLMEPSMNEGPIPEELQGRFTSMSEAQAAVNTYKSKYPNGPTPAKVKK